MANCQQVWTSQPPVGNLTEMEPGLAWAWAASEQGFLA